jgi:hypothetical protein
MRFTIAAALALLAPSSLSAQAVAPAAPTPAVDYSVALPIAGGWSYASAADGSEATFRDAGARPQLIVHCARAARQVTIAKPASGAAPFLYVWTTSLSRSLPSSFNPMTARLSATVGAWDPLLDALAFSLGRVAVTVSGQPPLVVPAWAEVARVIEDCRA